MIFLWKYLHNSYDVLDYCSAANCYDFCKILRYYQKWCELNDFFQRFTDSFQKPELIQELTHFFFRKSRRNSFYSEIRDALREQQKPFKKRCLFTNLNRFVRACSGNKPTDGKCKSWKSEIVVLYSTSDIEFFRGFLLSFSGQKNKTEDDPSPGENR